MHPNPQLIFDTVFSSRNLPCNNIVLDGESGEYGAASLKPNGHSVLFRVSKITPTKTGQFVTLWKRMNNGPIQPFDGDDSINFVIIHVADGKNAGQFIFPKKFLLKKIFFRYRVLVVNVLFAFMRHGMMQIVNKRKKLSYGSLIILIPMI